MKKIVAFFVILMVVFSSVMAFAETPLPSPEDSPEISASPTPIPTPTPTPKPTMAVIVTGTPTATADQATEKPEEVLVSAVPNVSPSNDKTEEKEETIDRREVMGELVFWVFVALVLGIWIGIFIGAAMWRKKSVFMTKKEKKIIGRLK